MSGQNLDGSDTRDDSVVLGELLSTDGDGQDGRYGNRDTTNQQDEGVVEIFMIREAETNVRVEDLIDNEDTDIDSNEPEEPSCAIICK